MDNAAGPSPPSDASPEQPRGERARTLDYLNIDASIFQGLLPVATFLVVNQFGPAQAAIGASFVVSAIIFVRNRARGVIRLLSVLGFSIVTISAIIGIVADSDRAFAAQNIVADVIFAAIFIASVLIGRPFIGLIARDLVPGIRPVMELRNPIFVQLTLLSAAINVVSAVARAFMIANLSVNTYVIVSRVVFLPVNIAFMVLCYVMITRTAIRIWPADEPYEHLRRRGKATPTP
jgi:intracellular septation protein A